MNIIIAIIWIWFSCILILLFIYINKEDDIDWFVIVLFPANLIYILKIFWKSPLSCYMKEFKYVKWTDKELKRLILEQQMNIQNLHGVRVTERLPENDFNCIVTEAERYINSVWHDMKEKPDFKKLPVLLKHKSGVIHFIDSTPTSWKYLIKHYVKWVYIRDLLPNEEK